MRERANHKRIFLPLGALFIGELMACGPASEPVDYTQAEPRSASAVVSASGLPTHIEHAVAAVEQVDALVVGSSGAPTLIRGRLGTLRHPGDSTQPPQGIEKLAPLVGLTAPELLHVSTHRDELGTVHCRYRQVHNGLPVVGGDLVVHTDASGNVYALNGTARRSASLGAVPAIGAEQARAILTTATLKAETPSLVYLLPAGGEMRLCWEILVEGETEAAPVRERVYVDGLSGEIVERHPLIHTALKRGIYTASSGTVLPGTLRRSEGSAADADVVVNTNYDLLGTTHGCYADLFGRDSYDNAGAALTSSVHYGVRYNNAFWNGSQMVYGDGDGSNFGNFATSLDVTAHELTHAVTEHTAGLVYSGESGALNESMSDVFGNVCEAYRNGAVDARTWMVGEDIYTPGLAGDALRYMSDPTRDGSSSDYYPSRYLGDADNGGVHWNSGIANLAFYLVAQGGSHPQGKTSLSVAGLGITKAEKIWYRALTRYMTSTTTFKQAQDLTAQAALDLYGSAAHDTVIAAWKAVGVGRRAAVCGRGGSGVYCALPSDSAFGSAALWQPDFSDANGWSSGPQYYGTIQFPDVNGDGRADVCGRGGSGIICAVSSGSGFTGIGLWQSSFSDANGWNSGPEYYATIQYPDLNGDGKADVCGRGGKGMVCALSTGSGFGTPTVWQPEFSDANGWNHGPEYYSTLQFPDMNGDGRADLCGRGSGGILCALSNGSSFGAVKNFQPDFSDANGWNKAAYYSTIRFPDLNGDRRADLCGRGGAGIDCALSSGTGLGPLNVWQPDFSDANGWNHGPEYYSTIQFADLDGDGKADFCGRGSAGINCALSSGSSFGASSLWQPDFSDANGWNNGAQYYSTIRLADVNGDGKADLCGRGSAGIGCAMSTGVKFGTNSLWQPDFSDASGWAGGPQYYSTLRFPMAAY